MNNQPNNNTKEKYVVYKNDLRYKNLRNLDINRIIWHDDESHRLFNEENLDTVQYRLSECIENKLTFLDLKQLDLNTFPQLPDYCKNIKHLFIADNNLKQIPDLTFLSKLETLEISHNNIQKMGTLPPSLIELVCSHNVLSTIDSNNLTKLKRLDCSYNKITKLSDTIAKSIEILVCNNNMLNYIPSSGQLRKVICSDNQITELGDYPNLTYLDCKNNNLSKLNNYENIIDLICSNNTIDSLPELPRVRFLEIFDTKITILPYYKHLAELYCNRDQLVSVSVRYKKKSVRKHRDKFLVVEFETHKD